MKFERRKTNWNSVFLMAILFVLVFCIGFNLGKYTTDVIIKDKIASPVAVQSIKQPVLQPINIVTYTCSGGKTITAKYYQGESKPASSPDQPPVPGGSVALELVDGRSVTLPQTISADGERYANADESFVFWGKGSTAFITEGNPNNTTYKDCTVVTETAKP